MKELVDLVADPLVVRGRDPEHRADDLYREGSGEVADGVEAGSFVERVEMAADDRSHHRFELNHRPWGEHAIDEGPHVMVLGWVHHDHAHRIRRLRAPAQGY